MGFAGAFLLGNPWLMLIAMFVITAGLQELRALEMEHQTQEVEDSTIRCNGRAASRSLCTSPSAYVDPHRCSGVRRAFDEPAE